MQMIIIKQVFCFDFWVISQKPLNLVFSVSASPVCTDVYIILILKPKCYNSLSLLFISLYIYLSDFYKTIKFSMCIWI